MISTETIILKVEGQTDGAVRATDKLASAQKRLKQEVQSTSKAMAELPAPQTTSLLGRLGEGLKSAGVDAKTFNAGLKDIGKGLTFDLIRQGLKGLNTEIKGVAGSALSAGVNGAAMGAAFGGPLGAAIGGAAGALVGLIRHTDQQSAASLRAAEAAKKHAAALQLVAQGETKARGTRRNTREALELAEEELNQARLTATRVGLSQDSPDVQRAVTAVRQARAEVEALNRADGVIWLEQRKREIERLDSIKALEAARQSGILTAQEVQKRLDELNGVEEKTAEVIEKQTKVITRNTEARYASVQAALDAQGATRRTDTAGPVIGFSTQLGAAADATQRDMYGNEIKIDTGKILAEREKELSDERAKAMAAREAKRTAKLESSFGKLEEINAYKVAFEGLGGAVTSAMQAWIDGSMSAGQAAKKFAAEYLSTVAAQLAIEALKEGAYAIASSIPGPFFNPAAAAGHAVAAAEYGVAAAAAAGAAKLLGGGAAAPSGGGGGTLGSAIVGSAGGGGGTSGGDQAPSQALGTKETFVIYTSTFADGSPRYRRQQAARVVNEVRGGLAWSDD